MMDDGRYLRHKQTTEDGKYLRHKWTMTPFVTIPNKLKSSIVLSNINNFFKRRDENGKCKNDNLGDGSIAICVQFAGTRNP